MASRSFALFVAGGILALATAAGAVGPCVANRKEAEPTAPQAFDVAPASRSGTRRPLEEPERTPEAGAATQATQPSIEVSYYAGDGLADLPVQTLLGRVVDPSGNAVQGLWVEIVSSWLPEGVVSELSGHARPSRVWDSASTEADGTFRLEWYDGGQRTLHIGFGERNAWIDRPIVADEFVEIVFDTNGVRVGGRVTRQDGTPCNEATVLFLSTEFPSWSYWSELRPWSAKATTDEAGRFAVDGVPIGSLSVSVVPKDCAPEIGRIVRVPAEGVDALEFTLKARHSFVLSGRVTDANSGAPLQGIEVQESHGVRATTDGDGAYRIEQGPCMKDCASDLTVLGYNYVGAQRSVLHREYEGSEAVIDFALGRPAEIQLRCVDSAGRPIGQVIVYARSETELVATDGTPPAHADTQASLTDEDGRVALVGISSGSPATSLSLQFWNRGVLRGERTFAPLNAGEVRDLGEIVLGPTTSMHGIVFDAAGAPAAGVLVIGTPFAADDVGREAMGRAVRGHGGHRGTTDASGRFSLVGIGPGLWDVYATRHSAQPGAFALRFDPGAGDVELRLPKLTRLFGRVVDADGESVGGARVALRFGAKIGYLTLDSTVTTAEGRFEFTGVATDSTVMVHVVTTERKGRNFEFLPVGHEVELRLR